MERPNPMRSTPSSTSLPSPGPNPGSRQSSGPTARHWQKPRIVLRETLEAVAADCSLPGGKSDPTCLVGFS